MARKEISNLWDRDMRIAIDQNFKELYNEYIGAGLDAKDAREKAINAVATSDLAKQLAEQANLTSDQVRNEMNNIIREQTSGGDVVPEVVSARGESATLGERLNSTDQQLAQTSKSVTNVYDISRKGNLSGIKRTKPTVTFIDDDTNGLAYDIIYQDFVQGRGVPYNFALITSRIDHPNGNHMMYDEFLEMKENPLVNFVNHTVSHPHLGDIVDDDVFEQEIAECEAFLKKHGIYTSCLVPPYGSIRQNQYEIARRHVDSILISTLSRDVRDINTVNNKLLDQNKVVRVDFSRDLEDLKSMVDLAVENNGLLVVATHVHYPQDETQSQNFLPQKLHDLIDYIQLQGVDITTWEVAFNRFKNLIEFDRGSSRNVGVSAGGFSTLSEGYYYTGSAGVNYMATPSDPPSSFPRQGLIKQNFNADLANQLGWPSAGTLITSTETTNEYAWQIFKPIRNHTIMSRHWALENAWSEWSTEGRTRHYAAIIDFGEVAPGQIKEIYLADRLIVDPNCQIIFNPKNSISPGILWFASIDHLGKIRAKIKNETSSSVSINAPFNITILDNPGYKVI